MSTEYPHWPHLTDDEGAALTEYHSDVCGDCEEGDHHGADEDDCGCRKCDASIQACGYRRSTSAATALAWRAAKEFGEVEL